MVVQERNLGQNDASVTDYIGNIAERAKSAVSKKLLHPLVEQYAELFAHSIRTPVLRRPDEVGLEYETYSSPRWTVCHSKGGSFQPIPTNF